jgi:UDP-N-acetyl-D-mannosaminuronate dehydrogenase
VTVNGVVLHSVPWPAADLASRDVVLILTAHAGYDWPAVVAGSPLVIDTRNATAGIAAPHLIRL